MQPLMNVVACIKIAAQHPLEVFPDQVFNDFSSPPMVIFVIADGRRADAPRADAPDVAILTLLSPSRFIGLHHRTGTDFCFETVEQWLCILLDPMQQFHQFSETDLKAVQISQRVSQLAQRQTHHRAQGGDDAGQARPNSSLPQHLFGKIHWCFMPALAVGTPSLVNPVFGDFNAQQSSESPLSHATMTFLSSPQTLFSLRLLLHMDHKLLKRQSSADDPFEGKSF